MVGTRQQGGERAAIVTGASSGIGLALARMLGREGYALTLAARRPDPLRATADALLAEGLDVQHVAGNLADEDVVKRVVAAHRERYGRLDVLVNNAGVGAGAPLSEIATSTLDLQLAVNVRSMILFYREAVEMLRAAGAEHRNALVVNTSSITGKHGKGWLSVYSASKAAVVGFTQAMQDELATEGIKSTALCPGWVDTPMTDFVKDEIPSGEMIRPEDLAVAVRALLEMSPACIVPEIQFVRPGHAV